VQLVAWLARIRQGCVRWTLKLLATLWSSDRTRECLARDHPPPLDDNDLKPWQKKMWCIANIDGEYIARMRISSISMPSA